MKRVLCVAALLLLPAVTVRADSDIQGLPPTQSADEIITSFDLGLEGAPAEERPFDEVLDASKLSLKLRNYYLDRLRDPSNDLLGWGQGGSLAYSVDKLGGFFGLNVEYFGSFKLIAPQDKDGTLLFEPGPENIYTLGVLNPKVTLSKQVISLWRQKIDLPFVNQQDNRMVPNTFEAYTLSMPKTENETFQYGVGYIASMKKRNQDTFDSMAEAAGATDKERGMIFGGARYFVIPEISLAAAEYYTQDVYNMVYTEAVHKHKFNDDWANTLQAQYADQQAIGEDLATGGNEYATSFWGLQNALSYKNVTGKAAFTMDDTGGDINSPYGSYPGYNSSIVEDYNRAGEKAWQLGLAYNFGRFGLKELGLSTAYVHGYDAIDSTTKEGIPNKDETDVTLDYKVADGMLNGLWIRLRTALVDQDGSSTTQDYRIIVNYEVPIFDGPAEKKEREKATS